MNPLKANEWRWPTDWRIFMGWLFALQSVEELIVVFRTLPAALHRQYSLPIRDTLLYAPVYPAIVAVIAGVAWWVIWKGKPSARRWGVVASLMQILTFLRQFIIPLGPVWGGHVGILFVGGVGLVTFLWYGEERTPSGKTWIERFYERNAPQDLFKKR